MQADLHVRWELGGGVNPIAQRFARRIAARVVQKLRPDRRDHAMKLSRAADAETAHEHRTGPVQPFVQILPVSGRPGAESARCAFQIAVRLNQQRHRPVVDWKSCPHDASFYSVER